MCIDLDRMARRVKSLRYDKGWRQSDLARKAGVSKAVVARIEQGRGCPGLDTASDLADALGCTLDRLACRGE